MHAASVERPTGRSSPATVDPFVGDPAPSRSRGLRRVDAERDLPTVAAAVAVVYLPAPQPLTISPLDFTAARPLIAGAYDVARSFLEHVSIDGPGLYRARLRDRRSGEVV